MDGRVESAVVIPASRASGISSREMSAMWASSASSIASFVAGSATKRISSSLNSGTMPE